MSAFPNVVTNWNPDREEWEVQSEGGMSLRDYFAAKLVVGLMGRVWDEKLTDMQLIEVWASGAYKLADAMLKARDA